MYGWMEAKVEQEIINLLVVICSICHTHEDTKQGTRVIVETDIVLYTILKRVMRHKTSSCDYSRHRWTQLMDIG